MQTTLICRSLIYSYVLCLGLSYSTSTQAASQIQKNRSSALVCSVSDESNEEIEVQQKNIRENGIAAFTILADTDSPIEFKVFVAGEKLTFLDVSARVLDSKSEVKTESLSNQAIQFEGPAGEKYSLSCQRRSSFGAGNCGHIKSSL